MERRRVSPQLRKPPYPTCHRAAHQWSSSKWSGASPHAVGSLEAQRRCAHPCHAAPELDVQQANGPDRCRAVAPESRVLADRTEKALRYLKQSMLMLQHRNVRGRQLSPDPCAACCAALARWPLPRSTICHARVPFWRRQHDARPTPLSAQTVCGARRTRASLRELRFAFTRALALRAHIARGLSLPQTPSAKACRSATVSRPEKCRRTARA